MSKHPINQTFLHQNKTLLQATFKKAVITAIQPQNNSVDVYFVENPNTIVRSIMLAAHIDLTKIAVGDKCRVDLFDEKNSLDMVVAYYY